MPQKDTLYGDLFVVGNFEANLIKKTGGTSSEFLKADGSVDSTAYLTTTPTLAQVTTAGNTTTNAITVGGLTVATNLIYTDTVNGRVGIGTTSPLSKLHVETVTSETEIFRAINPGAGSSVNRGAGIIVTMLNTQVTGGKTRLRQYDTAGYAARNFIEFVSGTGGFTGEGSTTISGFYEVGLVTNNTLRLWVASTGNVSIGSSTDAGYKLDVNGTGIFRGNLEVNAGGNGGIFVNNVYPRLIFGKTGTPRWSMYADTENSGQFEIGSGAGFPYNNFSRYIYLGISGQGGIGLFGIPNGNTKFLVSGSTNAQSNLAQGVSMSNTLVATANNDVLVGLDINPTFTSGAFTGLGKIAARIQSGALLVGTTLLNTDVISFPVQVNGSSQNIGAVWRNALSTGYTSFRFYNDQNLNTRAMEMGYAGSAYPSAIVTGGVTGESAYLTTTGAYPLQLGTNNTARFIVFSNGNVGVGTATDAGQKLQVSGSVFIKGTDSLSSTKVFEVQNGAGASIMDFRNATYAFFGCGQGGGSNSGFIFNYSNTSYTQFSGYNYGAGAGSYKPILMDTDGGGRNQGIFVNFGVTTNTPPNSDTEFGVLGRTSDSTTYISRFRNSGNTDKFAIRADGALFTNTLQGYSGTLNIPTNPPGTSNITITNGLITNIA